MYISLNDIQNSLKYCEEAIRLDRNSYKAYNLLGSIYCYKKDNINAIDCYETALKIHPKFTETLYNLGEMYLEESKYEYAKNILINSNSLEF